MAVEPQETVKQDFAALQQQSKEAVPTDKGLSPQEQYLYQHHLNNLTHGGYVLQDQGRSVSTIYNTTVEQDGKTYVIPTVWNGKILSEDEAGDMARQVGLERFPAYGSEQEANVRYMDQLHPMMERDVGPMLQIIQYLKTKGLM